MRLRSSREQHSVRRRARLALAIVTGTTVSLTIGVATASAATAAPRHVVIPGESLWRIAVHALPAGASDARIARSVARIAELNAGSLPRGASHLVSGQQLRLPRALRRRTLGTAARSIAAVRTVRTVRVGTGLGRPYGSALVAESQTRLACTGYGVRVDGVFGGVTQAAVTTFQRL